MRVATGQGRRPTVGITVVRRAMERWSVKMPPGSRDTQKRSMSEPRATTADADHNHREFALGRVPRRSTPRSCRRGASSQIANPRACDVEHGVCLTRVSGTRYIPATGDA